MTIEIEPTKDHPIPYVTADEEPKDFAEELAVAANTLDVLQEIGTPPEVSPEDVGKTKELFESAVKNKDAKSLNNPLTAFAAKEFLRVYSVRLAAEMNDVRSAITNKLMELANCGDPRFELKALELLGKHSDIALFTERSEVTVTYKNSSDLEEAIKERVKRLLNSKTIDAEPAILVNSLDDQLGKATYTPSKMIDEISDVKASDAR
jgi:hypothetical protein